MAGVIDTLPAPQPPLSSLDMCLSVTPAFLSPMPVLESQHSLGVGPCKPVSAWELMPLSLTLSYNPSCLPPRRRGRQSLHAQHSSLAFSCRWSPIAHNAPKRFTPSFSQINCGLSICFEGFKWEAVVKFPGLVCWFWGFLFFALIYIHLFVG